MQSGIMPVSVLVAHAALQDLEWSPPGSGDYLTRFEKHRDRLEAIASMKYGRGQIEENGSIVIQRGDLRV